MKVRVKRSKMISQLEAQLVRQAHLELNQLYQLMGSGAGPTFSHSVFSPAHSNNHYRSNQPHQRGKFSGYNNSNSSAGASGGGAASSSPSPPQLSVESNEAGDSVS